MRAHLQRSLLAVGLLLLSTNHCLADNMARSRTAVVATVHPLATDAGINALQQGGNAIDAAVAAALTLGVCDNYNSGLGGGCLIVVRLADGKFVAIDGREMAPAAATADMFVVNGKADTRLSQTGPLAVGVPGALAAYDKLIREHGKLDLRDLILPAASIAEDGFVVTKSYAQKIKATSERLHRFDGSRQVFFRPDGSYYKEGELLKQPDLARSYRKIAAEGSDWFYRGELPKMIGDWMAENGGILAAEDFANYVAKSREPIVSTYRDYKVVGMPPPSSGGVHVAQMLNILEHFDLGEIQQRNPVQAKHIIAEAMKLAFADRAYWLGDADYAQVPKGLASKEYAAQLAAQINPDKSSVVDGHGTPHDWDTALFNRHTTHIAAADAEGNWVAITATVNTTFGSKVIVPGTGIVLNNEMDDFSAQPGVPNAFGLVGAENNAVAPGKRPLSSMSPTIVLKDGQPILTVGAAGGPKIITQALLTIIRTLDYGQPLSEAIAGKRFHHQWNPDSLMVERGTTNEFVQSLEKLGHTVTFVGSGGVAQAIMRDDNGELTAVHDPRIAGKAAGL